MSQTMEAPVTRQQIHIARETKNKSVIHFAGDSGDGMQLVGQQLTQASAVLGNDVQTFADFPAEIRAPQGTIAGVSGFQLCFAQYDIHTPGDSYDTLVAMNPAAYAASASKLRENAIVIVDQDKWASKEFKKAKLDEAVINNSISAYRFISVPMTSLTTEALKETTLGRTQIRKTKNFFALGIIYWLYDRPLEVTLEWIKSKFTKQPELAQANQLALKAGYDYAMTVELFQTHYRVPPAKLPVGCYRQITGNQALALGVVASSYQAQQPVLMSGYPITPASDILHQLSHYQDHGIRTLQAEDEIAAIGAALGASYGGHLGLTCTSGPGLDLKSEMLGLAVMTELPLVVINVQRAGPSTGMPTKTEQADLLMALYGRHGEAPIPVLAPQTPGDCFNIMLEAFDWALTAMTPVIVLSDGYLANGAEPWRVPELPDLPKFKAQFYSESDDYQPYAREESTLARHWAVPGMPNHMHTLGGLEKAAGSGQISYDGDNHQQMIKTRADKIQRLTEKMPPLTVTGDKNGDVLVIGWGGTYGAIQTAVVEMQEKGSAISHVHLRHLWPLSEQLPLLCQQFKKVVVVEINQGQLSKVLRSEFLIETISITQMTGKPWQVSDLVQRLAEELS